MKKITLVDERNCSFIHHRFQEVERNQDATRKPFFPNSSADKESACNEGGYLGSIPGLGRSPGEGHGNPLQSSCLENPMDRGAWWATVLGVAKNCK